MSWKQHIFAKPPVAIVTLLPENTVTVTVVLNSKLIKEMEKMMITNECSRYKKIISYGEYRITENQKF